MSNLDDLKGMKFNKGPAVAFQKNVGYSVIMLLLVSSCFIVFIAELYMVICHDDAIYGVFL